MKQGPFAPSGLCCPADRHYYDPLRLPLDNLPFPGSAGYRQATLPGPQYPGPRRLSPVPSTTFRPFHAPYAGRFFDDRSRSEIVFPGLRQTSTGSAPPWPARGRGLNDDAAGFTSCCGLVGRTPPRGACHSTSTPPFRATPGVSYRGPWRLPGPDFHRLAILSLSSGYIVHIPSELGRRPDCWTYACFFNLRPSAASALRPRELQVLREDRGRQDHIPRGGVGPPWRWRPELWGPGPPSGFDEGPRPSSCLRRRAGCRGCPRSTAVRCSG
jgi:hypothetical protein